MKYVEWGEKEVNKLIRKLKELNWNKLPEEQSDRFVAAYSYDGNLFKIYKLGNNDSYKVYYDSLPYFNYLKKYDNMEKFQRFLKHFEGRKVVEIDDAGIGCPVGGIVIAIYSRYRDIAALKIVGLKYFQKPLFKTRQYSHEVAKRIDWAFKELNVTSDYFVRICPGDIFTDAVENLWKRGFNIITTRADGLSHVMAESRYLEYLRDLGVPDDILDVDPTDIDYAKFHKALNAFMRENRDFKYKYFKTGWYKH
jgi:hypothetical protein